MVLQIVGVDIVGSSDIFGSFDRVGELVLIGFFSVSFRLLLSLVSLVFDLILIGSEFKWFK